MWYTTRIYLRAFVVSFIRKWWEKAVDWDLFLYADGFCLAYQHTDVSKIEQNLNKNFSNIYDWFVDNKLSIHSGEDKKKCILFGT